MQVTIKDLAKELKLSVATISKALKDSYEISDETKRRVMELAAKLNYVPNPYASSLRKKSSRTIAVVLPEIADSFFAQAINGIEAVAQEVGYHVLIYLTHESFLREQEILKEFQNGRVDGILISVSGETPGGGHIQKVMGSGIPVLFFDRVCDDVDTGKIVTDDQEGGYKATAHLIEQGCKKITYLCMSGNLSISNNRMKGFQKAIVDYKIKEKDASIVECSNDPDDNYKCILGMMKKTNRPEGIIACVEKLTIPVYLACEATKLNIPKNVKVISFTNLPTAIILNPSLSTITQPAYEMGKTAARMLFRSLQKNKPGVKSETVVIPSVLTQRCSTSS